MLFVLSNQNIIKLKQFIIYIFKEIDLIYFTMFKMVSITMYNNEMVREDNPNLISYIAKLNNTIDRIKAAIIIRNFNQ